jgi:hypothetical protein
VREQSHLDEMRSAIRGDFARLAERRGEQELLRVVEAEPEPDGEETAAVPEDELDASPEPAQDEVQTRSWLARFFSP